MENLKLKEVLKQMLEWLSCILCSIDDEVIELKRIEEKLGLVKGEDVQNIIYEVGLVLSGKDFDIQETRERMGILKGLLGIIKTEND